MKRVHDNGICQACVIRVYDESATRVYDRDI